MRKIREENLDEMFDTRVKNITFGKDKKGVVATFVLEANTEVNPNDVDITYTVTFGKISPKIISASVGSGLKVYVSTLVFKNSLTGMHTFASQGYENVSQNVVFSTIARIVIRYFEKNTTTQAIEFTAAHSGLHKAYKILSMEAEKKGPLKWTNPSSSPTVYYITRKEIWDRYVTALQNQGE